MGGIVGILNSDGSRIDPALLEGMLLAIAHRGPDDSGIYQDSHAGLGHVRRVLGHPSPARQPLPNADRSLWITFDGEIYNDRELRKDLKTRGHAFATPSAAEVVLCAYEEYGEDCVRRFNGQWSLAIWDSRQRRLFASRDRFGALPFYYAPLGREFAFASEIKALLQHPGMAREIDVIALDQIFTLQAALPPRTIFRHIFELPPGYSLHWSDGVMQVFRHWQFDFAPDEAQHDAGAEEQLGDLLTDATRLRVQFGGGAASCLTGRLDSLLTEALVSQCSETPPAPLSIPFNDFQAAGASVAQWAGTGSTDPYTLHCSSADLGNVFPEVVRHAETLVLTTEPAALYLLSEFSRDLGFRVLMSGAGADELFGGCDIFKEAKTRRFWSQQPESPLRLRLLEQYFSEQPGPGTKSTAHGQAFFHARPLDLAYALFSHLPRWEQTARLKTFYSDDARKEIGDYDAREEMRLRLPARYKHWDPLCQAQFLEIAHHLPGSILSSQYDRMLTAHGVAGRFPFLDHRVAAFASRLPARSKLRGLSEQEILRRIASRFLPASEMRPRRRPERPSAPPCFFGTPELPVVCEYAEELLSRERIAAAGLFDPTAVERLVRRAQRGEATTAKDSLALTGILSAQLLVDQFVGARLRNDLGARPATISAAPPRPEQSAASLIASALDRETTAVPGGKP
jgi:asparagine synthase (glutamine-hydrolysing)